MRKELLLANLREIPDFPIPGILFYDVTTLFKNAECLQEMLDSLYELYKDKGITKVVGIESRGFILGGALAARLGAGFVMARKPGKLPAETTTSFYYTTIYWQQVEPWQLPIALFRNVAPRNPSSILLSNWTD
mgnify:CR=1 FL=1